MKNLTMSSLIVLGLATGIVGCDKDEKEKIVQVENQETVKQLEETRKELEAEQAKSLSLTGERDKAETEKKAAEDIKVQLENDKTELEAQLKEVEKQLDDAKAAGNDEDRVKELEDEAKDLNTQIADLEDAIAAKDEEITALNKTIDDVNAKLEASEQASVDLHGTAGWHNQLEGKFISSQGMPTIAMDKLIAALIILWHTETSFRYQLQARRLLLRKWPESRFLGLERL